MPHAEHTGEPVPAVFVGIDETAVMSWECTTSAVSQRHRCDTLEFTPTANFLGGGGRRGVTACGAPEAMDQDELDLWYADWKVPVADRRRVDSLPYCATCWPHLAPCGCLRTTAGAHRVGCPDHSDGMRGEPR